MQNIHKRASQLKYAEDIAKQTLKDIQGGRWYEGKDQLIDRLQQIIAHCRVERLELEVSKDW